MSIAHEYRARMQHDASAEKSRNRTIAVMSAGVFVTVAGIGGLVTYLVNMERPERSARSSEPGLISQWLNFGKGKQDGDSASKFLSSNCKAISSFGSGLSGFGIGGGTFKDMQGQLGSSSRKSRDQVCDDMSKGWVWKRKN